MKPLVFFRPSERLESGCQKKDRGKIKGPSRQSSGGLSKKFCKCNTELRILHLVVVVVVVVACDMTSDRF